MWLSSLVQEKKNPSSCRDTHHDNSRVGDRRGAKPHFVLVHGRYDDGSSGFHVADDDSGRRDRFVNSRRQFIRCHERQCRPGCDDFGSDQHSTGAGTVIGSGFATTISDLATLGGILYGSGQNGFIQTVNIGTGSSTPLPNSTGFGAPFGGALAPDAANNRLLYAPQQLDNVGSATLVAVNPATGIGTAIQTMVGGPPNFVLKAFSFDNLGTLYGIAGPRSNTPGALPFTSVIVTVDPNSGTITTIATITAIAWPDALFIFQTACVHGSSSITLADANESMAVHDIEIGQRILGADGHPATVLGVGQCWLRMPKMIQYHRCIVFEPDSLGIGVPNRRFAIDPGHPMCTPVDFATRGRAALRPAREFLDLATQPHDKGPDGYYYLDVPDATISWSDWDRVRDWLPPPHRRYDLILTTDSCGAYLANGVVVQARQSVQEPGYQHDSPGY